jgi:hypothetical protein
MRKRRMKMNVRATKKGYYGDIRRHPGDVFSLSSEKHFSTNWMETVDEITPTHTVRDDRIGFGVSASITEEQAMKQVPVMKPVTALAYDPLESAHTGNGVI